jgi:flagellar hook-length control protein FliK
VTAPTHAGADKRASGDANAAQSDDGTDTKDASAATAAAAQAQATADPAQPVAALIAVNAATDSTAATGNTAASSLAIGEQTKARAQSSLSRAGRQDTTPASDAQKASADASAPSGSNNANSTATTPAAARGDAGGKTATAPAPNSLATQPAQLQTNNADGATVPSGGGTQAVTDPAVARVAALATAPATDTAATANAQTASNAVNATAGDLSSLGLVAANSPTAATAATTAGGPVAAAVSIAGLPVAIAAHAQAGSSQFDIRLDPPELGRIDVQLSVDSNGQATTHVTVDRPETLALLQSQQPQLEHALGQAGLTTADNGLQFTLRDQSFTGQNNSGTGAPPNSTQLVIPDADLPPVAATQIYSRLGLGGGIDIRV